VTTAILWFASCSVACLFGFVVGALLRRAEIEELEQEVAFYDSDNQKLREVLHVAMGNMHAMQSDIEAVAGKYREADHVA
jgi:hypothetical protein